MAERDWLQLALEKGWLTPEQAAQLAEEARSRSAAERTAVPATTATVSPGSRPVPDEVRDALGNPARRLGRFVLLRELGRGGFGSVYKAWQTDLGRHVALKLLHSENEEDLQRFAREAQTAAGLSHPNIVPIFEVGQEEAGARRHFIAMKLIDGATLSRRRVTAKEAAALMRDAALALDYAHGLGVIHRDIKPQNIMTDETGRVWVMDFGLARHIQGGTTLTASGMMVGTPAYMSPEQARGELHSLTPKTDVYALGATLYELLTAKAPFEGSHAVEIAMKVVSDDPPLPRRVNPAIDVEIETIALKAMDKEPGRRYTTAKELADDLGRYLAGEPIAAHPPTAWYRLKKTAKRHLAVTMTLATALAAFVAAAGYFLGPSWVNAHGERRLVWPAGEGDFELRRDGYEAQRVRIATRPWRSSDWTLPLVPDHGFVELRTTPPGAEAIFLREDREVARARADGAAIRLPRGTLALRLVLVDHEPAEVPVDVSPGRTVPYTFTLTHDVGYLSVTCEPDGVRMHIGDQVVALPVGLMEMATGTYDVLFEKENCFPRRMRVSVAKAARPPAWAPKLTGPQWSRPPGVTCLHAFVEPMEVWAARINDTFSGVIAADVNLDGVPDAIIGDGNGNVQAFAGVTGEIKWIARTGGVLEHAPAAGDLDRDGAADVVVAARDGRVIALSGADGSRLWVSDLKAEAPGPPAIGDADGDGLPDVAVVARKRAYALSGRDGSVLWSAALDGEDSRRPAFSGTVVFVVTLKSVTALSRGTVAWSQPVENGSDPVVGDFDADGTADCVVPTASSMHAFSGKTGRPLWTASKGAFSLPAVGDVTGDGVADLAMSDTRQDVHAVDGRTGAIVWTHRSEGAVFVSDVMSDLDGDGVADLAIAAEDGLVVVRSGKDGAIFWRGRAPEGVLSPPALADVTGDGVADVILPLNNGTLMVLSGAPNRRLEWIYRPRNLMDVPIVRARLRAGRPADILAPTNEGRIVAIAQEDGARLWEYATGDTFDHPPTVGDVDGDGIDEVVAFRDREMLVLIDAAGRERWSCRVEGEGVAAILAELDGIAGPEIVVVSDGLEAFSKDGRRLWRVETATSNHAPAEAELDGDGVIDFIVAGVDENAIAVSGRTGRVIWKLKVGRSARAPAWSGREAVFVVDPGRMTAVTAEGKRAWSVKLGGPGATPAGIGDADGDGVADAIVVAEDGRATAVSGKTGRKLWEAPCEHLVDDAPVVADVDGDGKPEVLLADGLGRMVVLEGVSGEVRWAVHPGSPAQSWTARDVDGDGVAEVVVVSQAEEALFLRGRDGAVLEWYRRGQDLLIERERLVRSAAEGGVVIAERRSSARMTIGELVVAEAWSSVKERVEEEVKRPGARRDVLVYWRGLGRMGLGEVEGALRDFKEARRLGLKSSDLVVSGVEACDAARVDPSGWLKEAGVEAALRMMLEFTEEALGDLAGSVTGVEAHRLLLAGKAKEALAALPSGEVWDWRVLAVRAAAKRKLKDEAGAMRDLEQALVQNPWSPLLREMRVEWRK